MTFRLCSDIFIYYLIGILSNIAPNAHFRIMKKFRLNVQGCKNRRAMEVKIIQFESYSIYRGNLAKGYYLIELRGDHVFRGSMVIE